MANRLTLQDIKTEALSEEQLDHLAKLAGSYEALFSRRAMKHKAWGLKDKELTEQEYRDLIIKEYTFLKRPVLVLDDEVWIGNSAKVVAAMNAALG